MCSKWHLLVNSFKKHDWMTRVLAACQCGSLEIYDYGLNSQIYTITAKCPSSEYLWKTIGNILSEQMFWWRWCWLGRVSCVMSFLLIKQQDLFFFFFYINLSTVYIFMLYLFVLFSFFLSFVSLFLFHYWEKIKYIIII